MVKQFLLVALGGGLGSVLRYATSLWALKHFSTGFPVGTFVVNVVGCLVIGFLIGLTGKYTSLGEGFKLLFVVGFCGGYTTFSTFSLENMRLIEAGSYGVLISYVVASVLVGLLAVWAGNALARAVNF